MKIKQIVIASALLVSVATFAQKEELKTLKKIYNKDLPSATDVQDFKAALVKLEPLAVEETDKVSLNYYKAIVTQLEIAASGKIPSMEDLQKLFTPKSIADLVATYNATLEFEKKSGKKVFTDDINEDIATMKPMLLNAAVQYERAKKINEAASILYSVYQLDKKDVENLYYAANYAVNGSDFDNALVYYKELKDVNYTGEGTVYYAKNVATDQEESYQSKVDRDNLVRLKTHSSPRDEKIPSKKGEIYKNYALLLVEKGRTEEAKTALSDAKKANPEDVSMILAEADLYYKLKDVEKYKQLINEALVKNPNDVDLLFNLGIVSNNAKQYDEAEKYYTKVIELKPDYVNAYLNLSDIKLKPDATMVEAMNKIVGTSEKELKEYNRLKGERKKIFNSALPLLEKAYQLDSKNDIVKQNLLTVYNFLEMTDKYKELKAKM